MKKFSVFLSAFALLRRLQSEGAGRRHTAVRTQLQRRREEEMCIRDRVYISRLREKFRDNPDFELRTIRGFGYMGMPREDGNGQK